LPAPAAQPQGTPEFTFKDQKVRVVMIEGKPWFVAKDVCSVLFDEERVRLKGVSNCLRHIQKDEQRLIKKNTLAQYAGNQRGSGGHITTLAESGLYKLVMRSDKPEAKVFQGWVTHRLGVGMAGNPQGIALIAWKVTASRPSALP
jgi:prophage antirepressor-like protein